MTEADKARFEAALRELYPSTSTRVFTEAEEATVAKYLGTPSGKRKLRRAMGFEGSREQIARQLFLVQRIMQRGLRVIRCT